MVVKYSPNGLHSDSVRAGVVSQVEYDTRSSDWNIYVQGESNSFPGFRVEPVKVTDTMPDIRANEVYDLDVVTPDPLGWIGSTLTRKPRELKTKRVEAKVITQSAIATNSPVYLEDPVTGNLYVVSSEKLQKRSGGPSFTPPRSVETPPTTRTPIFPDPSSLPSDYPLRDHVLSGPTVSVDRPTVRVVTSYSSPSEIADVVGESVLHQEAAVRSLSVAAYDHLKRPEGVKKSNALIIGSTGTGKTELARIVSELLGVPFVEAKLAGHSSSGYVGSNLITVFGGIYPHRRDPNADRSLIFLDEIDKTTGEDNSDFGPRLQNELIGWVESAQVKVPLDTRGHFDIDTTDMLFIGAGAFVGLEGIIARRLGKGQRQIGFTTSDVSTPEKVQYLGELFEQVLPEDLVEYGLKPELVGRFPVIAYTKPLTQEDLIDILKEGSRSPFRQQLHLLQEGYGVTVEVDERVYGMVATAAQRLGTGARGLEAMSNQLFQDIKFNIAEHTAGKNTLSITPELAYERLKRFLPEGYSI